MTLAIYHRIPSESIEESCRNYPRNSLSSFYGRSSKAISMNSFRNFSSQSSQGFIKGFPGWIFFLQKLIHKFQQAILPQTSADILPRTTPKIFFLEFPQRFLEKFLHGFFVKFPRKFHPTIIPRITGKLPDFMG